MDNDLLFTDGTTVKTITPYRKLRELRGWSLEEAAERFHLSKKTLIQYELARSDPPKWLVRRMDEVYGCGGRLLAYWIPRFSMTGEGAKKTKKKPQGWWHNLRAFGRYLFMTV